MFPNPQPQDFALEYASLVADVGGGNVDILAQAYGWADAIAVRFAQTFRSAFVVKFFRRCACRGLLGRLRGLSRRQGAARRR